MLEIKISTWQYNALCRQHSTNLFFPPATFEKKEDREKRELKAKAVCLSLIHISEPTRP